MIFGVGRGGSIFLGSASSTEGSSGVLCYCLSSLVFIELGRSSNSGMLSSSLNSVSIFQSNSANTDSSSRRLSSLFVFCSCNNRLILLLLELLPSPIQVSCGLLARLLAFPFVMMMKRILMIQTVGSAGIRHFY